MSVVLALLSLATASAQTVTLVNDDFTNAVRVGAANNWTGVDRDGGTSNDYVQAYNDGTLAVGRSDANAPSVATGITGNSLTITGGAAGSVSTYFTPTTLGAGDSISLSFNFRSTAVPGATTASTFRFGLFDSGATRLADNNLFAGAGAFTDDTGYAAFYYPGTGSTTYNVVGERNPPANFNILRDASHTLGTSDPVSNDMAANTTYAVTLDVVRALDGNSITYTGSFNGLTRTLTDTADLVTEFDHLAIFIGSQFSGTQSIDDVVVTYTPAASANPDLLAYFPFDSDFTDASGNNNHLVNPSGSPDITTTSGESAVGGGALNLDQSGTQEFLGLTDDLAFDGTTAWSMAWWGKRSTSAGAAQGMIAGKITDSNNFIWTPNNPAAGSVEGLRLRDNTGASTDYDGIVDDNAYHHWAVVYNGSGSVEVWRDNVSLGSKAFSGIISLTHVGAGNANQTNSFYGQIDELYVYDGAINAAKVDELYSARVVDNTPPTLAASGIVTNQGSPVVANTPVTYTVTFSEDMDAATVDASDFGNAGTAPISIGAPTEISPGVFSVVVTPTGPGSLQLKVLAGAVLNDAAGNPLNTGSAIVGETSITVNPAVPVTRLRVYLIGGQSNADGRAVAADLPTTPVNLQQPQDDVDYYETSLTTLRPLGEFGPEITLGRSMADAWSFETGTRVAIIKYGVSGTSLDVDWKAGGNATTTNDGPRYVSFQSVVTNGLAALDVKYPDATIEIEGMLWMQGERDVVIATGAAYQANLTAFIADVRATYGADLPFIVGRLSTGQTSLNDTPAEETQFDLVRDAQTAVAAADPRVSLINTDGYGIKDDDLHFNAAGQQALGSDSADALFAYVSFTSPPTLQRLGNGDIEVTLADAFPGFLYTLQNTGSLLPNDWSNGDAETAAGTTVVLTYTPGPGETKRFFRVTRNPAP